VFSQLYGNLLYKHSFEFICFANTALKELEGNGITRSNVHLQVITNQHTNNMVQKELSTVAAHRAQEERKSLDHTWKDFL
jgi:hypothetical protein